jgi:polar amino acid transport system substrate-binding protein
LNFADEKPKIYAVNLVTRLLFVCAMIGGPAAAQEKELVVGMEMNFPPFEMLDAQGQPAGVSVDMARALGEYLNRPVRFENIPFDGLIPSLKTGKIDLLLSSITVTAERAKSIDFTDSYLKMGLSILANKNAPIESIEDVNKPGIRVAVKKGTTGHIYATQHLKAAKIFVFNEDSTCATEVSQGKADCMVYDQVSIFQHWRRYPDTTKAILRPFQQEEWAMGVRKGNDPLREQVNAFLKQFKESGGFNELGNKYFGENKKTFEELGIPFYF